jgi:hypothetical protein
MQGKNTLAYLSGA